MAKSYQRADCIEMAMSKFWALQGFQKQIFGKVSTVKDYHFPKLPTEMSSVWCILFANFLNHFDQFPFHSVGNFIKLRVVAEICNEDGSHQIVVTVPRSSTFTRTE